MSILKKREIPLVIAFITGILGSVGFFIAIPIVGEAISTVEMIAILISAFTLGLGTISALRHHGNKIFRKIDGWLYSIVILGSMFLTIATGLIGTMNDPTFVWIYTNISAPLKMAILGILALFASSAIFRAFKARSLEATVFLICAILTLLKNAPMGATIWIGFDSLGTWILNIPGTAGMRGMIIAAGIGVIGFGLRTIMGYEKGWLYRRED